MDRTLYNQGLRADSLANSSNFPRTDARAISSLVGSQLTALHMLTFDMQFYVLLWPLNAITLIGTG
jgi:hypothetical protein